MGVTIKKPVNIIEIKSLSFGPKECSRDIIIGIDDYGNTYQLGYLGKETNQLSWNKIKITNE